MIASENYTSPAVMQAVGSVLTNKYAEGYPGRRYYGGCEHVDVVETWRAIGPSNSSAPNMPMSSRIPAARPTWPSISRPLAGRHRPWPGSRPWWSLDAWNGVEFLGPALSSIGYGVTRDTHRIDFDQVAALAREHKPKLIVAGASAYPREIQHARFAEIAREVGAKLFVDMAHYAGLVAAGFHDNPVPLADFVTTTTHKTLRGPGPDWQCASSNMPRISIAPFFPASRVAR